MTLIRATKDGAVPLTAKETLEREADEAAWAAGAAERAFAVLRGRRNDLLRGSDWTQIPDAKLAADKKTAWADYRQALRDLPANSQDPGNPSWPKAPA